MIKISLISVFLLSVLYSNGQTENVFLNRSYWKSMPSIEHIKVDIEKGHDPSEFNQHKFDPITWAIIEGAPNTIVAFLLDQRGNHVDKRAHDGRTPIFWAAYRGNIELMKQLIEKGAKTDLIDDHGYSLINFSATTGQLDMELYDICIENGASIDQEFNNDGATPLLLIIPYLESPEMIRYFTEKGLSFDQIDSHGNNAFVYAARTGNHQLMEFALDQGLDPRANNDAAMIFASKGTRRVENSVEVYQYLSALGLSTSAQDDQGMTALHHLASQCKDTVVLDFFTSNSSDLNAKDSEGNSPWLIAVSNNEVEIINYFSQKSGIEHSVNGLGENALHLAAKRNDPSVLDEVLKFGLDINSKRSDGMTALHIAAMKAKDDHLLKELITAGADKHILTEFKESAFDLANENEVLQSKHIPLTFLK